MVSISGTFRQQLPSLRKGLKSRVDEADEALRRATPKDKAGIEELQDTLAVCSKLLLAACVKIQDVDKSWELALRTVDPGKSQEEAGIYETSALNADTGYYALLTAAEVVNSKVEVRIARLAERKTELQSTPQSQSTTASATAKGGTAGTSSSSATAKGGAAGTSSSGATAQTGGPSSVQQTAQVSNTGANMKLPKVELRKFDGNILRFQGFWSVFDAAVHCRTDLSNVMKMSYLLPLLEGEAEEAVKGYTITDKHYDAVVQRLKDRFCRADDRYESLLHAELRRLPQCGKSVKEKRKTMDACESVFTQLEQAGRSLDPGKSLVFDLLGKFPQGMIWDLDKRYHVGVYSVLSDVRKAIEKSITEEELTSGFIQDLTVSKGGFEKPRKNGGNNETGGAGFHSRRPDPTDRTFEANAHSHNGRMGGAPVGGSSEGKFCVFCEQKGHSSGACAKYKSGRVRIQRLKEISRCGRCTRKHTGKCEVALKCYHCGKEHHSSMCFRQYPGGGEQRPGPPPQTFYNSSFPDGSSTNPFPATAAGGYVWVPTNQMPGFTGAGGHTTGTHGGIGGQSNPPSQPPQIGTTTGGGDNGYTRGQNNHSNSASEVVNFSSACSKNSLFQTALVKVLNCETGTWYILRVVVDTLSNRTYITDDAAKKLGLATKSHDKLYVSVFGSKKNVEVSSRVVSLGLVQRNGVVREIEANTTKMISNSSFLPGEWPEYATKLLKEYKENASLADNPFDKDKTVDILLGADYAWDIITGSKMNVPGSGIFFIPSAFGLMLGGQVHYSLHQEKRPEYTMLCITDSLAQYPTELGMVTHETKIEPRVPDMDEFFRLDRIGISDSPTEDDDVVAYDAFKKSVLFQKDRYYVKWLWKEDKRCLLPSNYDTCVARFRSLNGRVNAEPELLGKYRDTIRDQVDRGFIERVPENQVNTTNAVHYMPHHPVFKPSSTTTKMRIVYDASSKRRKENLSLNECLYRGPVILPDMCQLLIRFRSNETMVLSDIEKAFLQVGLQEEDRDVTRFLWYADDQNPSCDPKNITIYRFCRVPFGIICSPFLLGATIVHHLENHKSDLAEQLINDIYVDNIVSGVPDGMTPLEYYKESKSIFADAGMNLREFCSNSRELMSQLPETDRVKESDVKVLGLQWDSANTDTLRLPAAGKWFDPAEGRTKRKVLQAVASLFDPLGFFQPSIFLAKVFLQKLWSMGKSWDEMLDADLIEEWFGVKESLDGIFDIRVPRFVGKVTDECQLIAFGDASGLGYGTVIYLRSLDGGGRVWSSNLLFSKSRLAPIPTKRVPKNKKVKSEVSLPRLELLGAFIAVKAAEFCREALQMKDISIVLFSDSECVLHWLAGNKDLKKFVRRRVEKIRNVEKCTFRYVSTSENPADFLTRGKTVRELEESEMWWHGPSYLTLREEEWPETRLPPASSDVLRQVKAEQQVVSVTFATDESETACEFRPFGLEYSAFSKLSKMVRVVCLCLKFLRCGVWNRLSDEKKNKSKLKNIMSGIGNGPITRDDYEAAIAFIVKGVQSVAFGKEIKAIESKTKNCLVQQLNLQQDDGGLLRVVSRFAHADLPESTKNPVLLPKNHEFPKLVILDVHGRLKHAGVTHTLSELRREFWVPQGRALVKKTLKPCIVCRMMKSTPVFSLPPMPPWPKERVSRSAPFQFVGVDYFGPMKVRVFDRVQKMWACLFTCLSTRAVHLEPVLDCTSTEFFKSFIRFVSRRGYPQQMISDNGAQFHLTKVLADRSWKETPEDEELLSYSAKHGIAWKFIIELAPWQGGHYERLVGVVKSVLKSAVGRRLLSWSDLVTLLTEAEAIVNSRPITYVNNEADSGFRVLRPVDFLLYRPTNAPPEGYAGFSVRDLGDAGKLLASVWKQRERYINKLWEVWYAEYLLSLRERANVLHRQGRARTDRVPRVGEVVLIKNEGLPRGSWKLARVITLIRSADKKIRAAGVRLANGVLLRRAVNFLIPLEIVPLAPSNGSAEERNEDGADAPNALAPGNGSAEMRDEGGRAAGDHGRHQPAPDALAPSNGSAENFPDDDPPLEGFTDEDVARTKAMLDLYDDAADSESDQD